MPNPISSATPSAPNTIELEPFIVTGKVREPTGESAGSGSSLSDLSLQCLSKIDGVALVFAGAATSAGANPVVGVLAGLKAGLELAQCIVETDNKDLARQSLERAYEECRSEGGVPSGIASDMTCTIAEDAP